MRDAFGGTFMIELFMVFFIIYVSIIGVALNFAKIYRIKNNVINILEQNQYKYETGVSNEQIYGKLDTYLKKVPYEYPNDNTRSVYTNHCKKKAGNNGYDGGLLAKGVCVVKKGTSAKPYYNVTVYYMVELPFLEISIPITASGETIVIS